MNNTNPKYVVITRNAATGTILTADFFDEKGKEAASERYRYMGQNRNIEVMIAEVVNFLEAEELR